MSLDDCRKRGWVVYNWPIGAMAEVVSALLQESLVPNRVAVLQISAESVCERLTNRETDPVTGIQYHALYDPATDSKVRQRLHKRYSTYAPAHD